LRAHLTDLRAGRVRLADVKLMVLGNGGVGKTQICRRLCGEPYDDSIASTHGISVRASPSSHDGARLQIWDFGGQDIYHGTHILFMRSRSLFLLVWTPGTENMDEYEHNGIKFRNYPLPYWLDYVRLHGGPESPLLVVETRCDTPGSNHMPPEVHAMLNAFPVKKLLDYSAKTNLGRAALNEALCQAVAWLRAQEGTAEIGAGRFKVKRRLEEMHDSENVRTISQDAFLALCREAGGIAAPEPFLAYLDRAGTIFYRKGLFDDQVILDQGWAFDAIYALLHRDKCVRNLRRLGGRFVRSDLGDWLWDDAGYSIEEQKLFLSLMRSCGICFAIRDLHFTSDDTEYIAPDFLPEKDEIEETLAARWKDDSPGETAECLYELLHPGIIRSIISAVGEIARVDALFWRGGLCAFESETRSRVLIIEERTGGWHGLIRIRTQEGQAALVLQKMITLVEQVGDRLGMRPGDIRRSSRLREAPEPAALQFRPENTTTEKWYVSYAWGDDLTAEGRERNEVVDRLCTAANARGIEIRRDKNVLHLGDRIDVFMRDIGAGDRIFVVLSDKYLHSPYCMFELSEIWRNSRQEGKDFLKRVRIYALPDAKIWEPTDWVDCAIYWKQKHDDLDGRARQHGAAILGEHGNRRLLQMQRFYIQVADILGTLAGIVQPRTLEELERYGLEDRSGPSEG
jgi:internalin A